MTMFCGYGDIFWYPNGVLLMIYPLWPTHAYANDEQQSMDFSCPFLLSFIIKIYRRCSICSIQKKTKHKIYDRNVFSLENSSKSKNKVIK